MAENVNTEPAAPSAQSAATSASSAPPQLQDLPSASPRAVSFSQDSWNPSSNHHRRPSRRRSAQERINDILEDARERAEFIAQSSPNNLSPRLQPLLGSSSRIPNYVSSGSPRHGSPRHGSPRHGSPRHGSPRHGSPRHGSPRHGSPRAGSPRLGPVTIQEEATQNGVRNGVITAEPEQLQHFQYPAGTNTDGTTRRRSTRPPVRNLSLSSSHADLGDVTEGRQREESRWKKTLRYFKSIELENKGSVARDHLALERTFLAWLRTSLAFASIGIAITQLFRLNTSLADDKKQSSTLRHLGKPLGATFLGISILILFLGYNRYLESQYWVIRGKFPASRGTIILVSFIAFTVTMASLIVVVAVQRDS